jgi:phosphoribosylformylglycinamidine cyclo-ligase
MSDTYKNAGVDIDAGDETVDRIKAHVKSTANENVLGGVGFFGGFYRFDPAAYREPVLVSSVDGVGTKLMVAVKHDKHDAIGEDIVNHCVNDIAVCGATPLFFLDYVAFGKLDPARAERIVAGMAKACRENECALVGGETAEMPGLYASDDYDLAGTIVGVVEKSKIVTGERVRKGDVLVGFRSNGLHTNGYSLARKVLLDKYSLTDRPGGLERDLGDELLIPHKSYLKLISALLDRLDVKAFSHVTGGGLIGNTARALPEERSLDVDWSAWETPAIFRLIQEAGAIADDEMRRAFNMGVGLIAIVEPENLDAALEAASDAGEPGFVVGNVV